jgi:hypothetical protein
MDRARPRVLVAMTVLALSAGCARATIPDPRDAVRAYQAAAAKGDARAIHGMLSERSRKSLAISDVERILTDERAELATQA